MERKTGTKQRAQHLWNNVWVALGTAIGCLFASVGFAVSTGPQIAIERQIPVSGVFEYQYEHGAPLHSADGAWLILTARQRGTMVRE